MSDKQSNSNNHFVIEPFVTDMELRVKLMLKTRHGEQQVYDTDRVLMLYKGESSRVEIPCGVTVIGNYAFCGNIDVETIVIPATVKRIASNAFLNCLRLKEVIIEGSALTAIDPCAFACCSRLEKINIPNSVCYIGDAAFNCCEELRFADLPSFLQTLGEAAFAGCQSLCIKKFPKSLKKFSKYVFSQTDTSYIPDTVTEIDEEAFCLNWCEEIFIPLSVKKIGRDAFPLDLQTIYYEGGETQWKSIEIDNTTDWLKNTTITFNCKRQ